MEQNPTLEALGLSPDNLYQLVNLESDKVMGWSESPEPLLEDAALLVSDPEFKQFNRLEVRDAEGNSLGLFSREP